MPRSRLLAALLLTFALATAACGDDDTATGSVAADDTSGDGAAESGDRADADDPETFPMTIESAAGSFTLDAVPERIVSLSPMATEVLFAIGAGEQVAAVDSFSYYPPEAPVTDLAAFDPNIEAILSYEPDLVIIAYDTNELVASLTAVDVPVYLSDAPVDIESGYAGMADLGVMTGHVDDAATAIAAMRAAVDDAFAGAPDTPVRVYHELDDTFFSVSSYGFVGEVYAGMGAENIADAADADRTGYPQLTQEAIVEADPELIVITDQAGYTAADVASRPGWDRISAVETGNIVVVDTDISSRWGPRLPEFIAAVADALSAVASPVG